MMAQGASADEVGGAVQSLCEEGPRPLRHDGKKQLWRFRPTTAMLCRHAVARASKNKAKLVRRRELRFVTDTRKGDRLAWAYLKVLAREASTDAKELHFRISIEYDFLEYEVSVTSGSNQTFTYLLSLHM